MRANRATRVARWQVLALLTVTGVCVPLPGQEVVTAAPGDLDPTFGQGGTIVVGVDTGETRVHRLARQTDGRIIAVGETSTDGGDARLSDFAVVRLTADGSPDDTFGSGGVVRTDFDGGADQAVDVAIQPDGRIVVLGFTAASSPDGSGTLLVRYNSDGTLDTTFGINGKAFMQVPWSPAAVALQPDGAIVVGGTTLSSGYRFYRDLALTRYHADGSLDTGFGVEGRVTIDVRYGRDEHLADIALQNDGRIVVLGRTFGPNGDAFALVRFMPDGTVDWSFGLVGRMRIDNHGDENEAHELEIQADGKLVVAGSRRWSPGNRQFYVQRYTADGWLDPSFSGDGKATFRLNGQASAAQAMVLDPSGRIVLAGWVRNGAGGEDFGILRVNADGSADTSFGTGGWATADLSPSDVATAVLLQPDGKALVAGNVRVRLAHDLALARFDGGQS